MSNLVSTPFDPAKFKSDLAQFTGTEYWYQTLNGTLYTDGVKFVAEQTDSYWLLTEIALMSRSMKDQRFLVFKLKVSETRGALEVWDGNDNQLAGQSIPFTDFPLPEFTFWVVDNVILLPSEY